MSDFSLQTVEKDPTEASIHVELYRILKIALNQSCHYHIKILHESRVENSMRRMDIVIKNDFFRILELKVLCNTRSQLQEAVNQVWNYRRDKANCCYLINFTNIVPGPTETDGLKPSLNRSLNQPRNQPRTLEHGYQLDSFVVADDEISVDDEDMETTNQESQQGINCSLIVVHMVFYSDWKQFKSMHVVNLI